MLDKQAITYLHAMDIDLWSSREPRLRDQDSVAQAPLYIAAKHLAPEQRTFLKQLVAAIDIDWQQVKLLSPEHLPSPCQSLVLWTLGQDAPSDIAQVIKLDFADLFTGSQAKRQLWERLCQAPMS